MSKKVLNLLTRQRLSRRDFLKTTAATGLGATLVAITPLNARAAAQEPVTIRLIAWGNPTEVQARQATIAMFEAMYPHIRVDFLHVPDDYNTKLQTMLAGGDYPDVIFLGNGDILTYATRGQLLPLNAYIEKDNLDTSDIFPVNLELYNVDGVQYGFPIDAPNTEIFYNKTMFETMGVEPPPSAWNDASWTWDAFLEKATALTDSSKNQWGFQVQTNFRAWWAWVTANGGRFFNEDGSACVLNEPPAVEALQFLADLIHVHKVSPPLDVASEMGGASNLFQAGIIAMMSLWPALGFMRSGVEDKFEWDVAPRPAGAAGKTTTGGGTGHVISSQTNHPDEAWTFLEFMISAPAVTEWTKIQGNVPPLQSVAKSNVFIQPDLPPEHVEVFIEGNAYLRPDPRHPKFVQASQIAVSELDRLWTGSASAQEVADRIVKEVNQLL